MKKKTDNNELKKLSRIDLLEILVKQEDDIERLTGELTAAEDRLAEAKAKLAEAERRLNDRSIQLKEAGSIAEAALKVSGIFDVAQQAADSYLKEIEKLKSEQEKLYEQKEAECNAQVRQMLQETAEFCNRKKAQAINEEKNREGSDKSGSDYDPVSFWADLL